MPLIYSLHSLNSRTPCNDECSHDKPYICKSLHVNRVFQNSTARDRLKPRHRSLSKRGKQSSFFTSPHLPVFVLHAFRLLEIRAFVTVIIVFFHLLILYRISDKKLDL